MIERDVGKDEKEEEEEEEEICARTKSDLRARALVYEIHFQKRKERKTYYVILYLLPVRIPDTSRNICHPYDDQPFSYHATCPTSCALRTKDSNIV